MILIEAVLQASAEARDKIEAFCNRAISIGASWSECAVGFVEYRFDGFISRTVQRKLGTECLAAIRA